MNKIFKFSCCILLVLLFSCSSSTEKGNISNVVSTYYEIYQNRKDFKKFMDFYAEEVVLEDIINGDQIIGKEKLSQFFNWDDPNFQLMGNKALVIKDQIINQNKVVTTGHFTAFKWGELSVEAMNFTTILYFNDSEKIIKQIDWINYPSTVLDYTNRKNSNDWIEE